MQPTMPTTRSGRFFFRRWTSPAFESARSSACSRTEQVLKRMTSASSFRSVVVYPWESIRERMRSLSRTFIWQP